MNKGKEMKSIPISEMTPERLRAELQSSINLNGLLNGRIAELEKEFATYRIEARSKQRDFEHYIRNLANAVDVRDARLKAEQLKVEHHRSVICDRCANERTSEICQTCQYKDLPAPAHITDAGEKPVLHYEDATMQPSKIAKRINEPATFLHECKWQVNTKSGVKCTDKTNKKYYDMFCSKRCESPEKGGA